MENLNPKDTNVAVVVSTPLKGDKTLNVTFDGLSTTQKHRYAYLVPLFGDTTLELIPLVEPRGRNSWANVNSKITNIQQASYEQQRYNDAMFDGFELDKVYTSGEIIGVIGDIRRDTNLPPYSTRIKTDCEKDFFSLFIVHEVYQDEVIDGVTRKKLVGYKPVFQLRPQDQA
jgi:hypothetical protein